MSIKIFSGFVRIGPKGGLHSGLRRYPFTLPGPYQP